MKYFAKMTRPVQFSGFAFKKGTTFEVDYIKAYNLYGEWGAENLRSLEESAKNFEDGNTIHVHNNAITVYGMAWDDKELFTRRLKGHIAAEIWK